MGTRYSNVAISGWNQNPPPDDGTQVSSNQLQWSKHLAKIGNPLKTMAEAINSALVTALSTNCRAITSSDATTAAKIMETYKLATCARGLS